MLFRIVGLHKETGEGIDTLIEAPSLLWARRIAERRGVRLDSIDPVLPNSPAPSASLKRFPTSHSPSGGDAKKGADLRGGQSQ